MNAVKALVSAPDSQTRSLILRAIQAADAMPHDEIWARIPAEALGFLGARLRHTLR
jgi:hypothetical protein